MDIREGDVIQVGAGNGHDRRLGRILRVEGEPGHKRMVVRWEDEHESLFIPSGDVRVIRRGESEMLPARTTHAQSWEPLGS